MKRVVGIFLGVLGFSSCTPAMQQAFTLNASGTWTQVDDTTLRFVGSIDEKTDTNFFKMVTPKIKRILVSTSGGNVERALPVADYIYKNSIELDVDGICGSSCANYWFLAASKKKVRSGSIVFFHGTLETSWPYIESEMKKQLSGEKLVTALVSFKAQREKERAFYRSIRLEISPFMAFSSEVARQFNQKLNLHKSGYMPSPEELECLGVKNLEMWYPRNEVDSAQISSLYRDDFVTRGQLERSTLEDLKAQICTKSPLLNRVSQGRK